MLARTARLEILEKISGVIAAPRAELLPTAPRMTTVTIRNDQRRDVIGPGGQMVRSLEASTGASVALRDEVVGSDTSEVEIFATDPAKSAAAMAAVRDLVAEMVEGDTYEATVVQLRDFGAIVETSMGEALLHVSEVRSCFVVFHVRALILSCTPSITSLTHGHLVLVCFAPPPPPPFLCTGAPRADRGCEGRANDGSEDRCQGVFLFTVTF